LFPVYLQRKLAYDPLLERSIRNRSPYLDPLNHVQVELLKEHRKELAAGEVADEQVLRGIQLTINGISAGFLHAAPQSRIAPETGVRYGPGSAAHHAVKNGVLRCVRGTTSSPVMRSRLHGTLYTRIDGVERCRTADVKSVSLLTAETQIGDGFRYVDFSE
jgi:hypothetical protein